ncbi:MAG: hypothetical protein AAB833_02015 [Patescibacteria group bacterium]
MMTCEACGNQYDAEQGNCPMCAAAGQPPAEGAAGEESEDEMTIEADVAEDADADSDDSEEAV